MSMSTPTLPADTHWREDIAYLVGMQAYVYGFPALRYLKDRHRMVAARTSFVQCDVNSFWHAPVLSDHTMADSASVCRDTLYSAGWADLRSDAVVVTAPAGDGRYIDVQLVEFYSDVIGYVSPHLAGGRTVSYLVAGPDWDGDVPDDVDGVHRCPTPWIFLVGRVYCSGADADLLTAVEIQAGLEVVPLSQWTSGDRDRVTDNDVLAPFPADGDALADFRTMNAAMTENPPPEGDEALMRMFAQVGLGPAAAIDLDDLDEHTQRGLIRALADGERLLAKLAIAGGDTPVVNHWFYGHKHWGRMAEHGDLLGRASPQAYAGMVEHWVEMAAKLRTFEDADGQPLDGRNDYLLRFEADQFPPSEAFWSVTVYNDEFNLVESPINRYLVSDASDHLVYGDDGSLEVHLRSTEPPAELCANWLPTPPGPFNLFLRSYVPTQEVIDQTYAPPPVRRLS